VKNKGTIPQSRVEELRAVVKEYLQKEEDITQEDILQICIFIYFIKNSTFGIFSIGVFLIVHGQDFLYGIHTKMHWPTGEIPKLTKYCICSFFFFFLLFCFFYFLFYFYSGQKVIDSPQI
jgi:hypothetical protein